jgi:dTMP kinase
MTRSLGRFISVEGVDGAGKSSHLDFIARRLEERGHRVLMTREPGGTELAERLRQMLLGEPMDPVAETLLMFAARSDHVSRVIQPALRAGTWVVCDRFTEATVAYQGAGKGVSIALIRELARAVHPGLQPDRTLVFDCSYEVARQRLERSGKALDRFEREDQAFFERVRNSYLAQARAEPERITVIDASVDPASVRAVLERSLPAA